MALEFEYLYIHQDKVLPVIEEDEEAEPVKEDTFHDSGTSGHEPDSLEAIETLMTDETMVEAGHSPPPEGGKTSEAIVLLQLERCAHRQTRRTLQIREMTIAQLRSRVVRLEKDRLDKVPVDATKEISRLNANIIQLEKVRDELTLQNFTLKSRLAEVTSKINDPAATYQVNKDPPSCIRYNNEKDVNEDDAEASRVLRKATYKIGGETQRIRQLRSEFDAKEDEYKLRINELEVKLRNKQNSEEKRRVKELENRLEEAHRIVESTDHRLHSREEEVNILKLDLDTLNDENRRLKDNLSEIIIKNEDLVAMVSNKGKLEEELNRMQEDTRILLEDFNRERVLRKKYYNQVEEMKGKIRVFCRVRPVNELERHNGGRDEPVQPEDQYSLRVETAKGVKSFLFDRVFDSSDDQESVFQDTSALIQSAMDGYNATIMAYGQTGSGKTYTMLGTGSSPGIAPRAFHRLFQLIEDGKARQDVSVQTYMLELYNDKFIDLLRPHGYKDSDKLEIKKDKQGAIYVQGTTIRNIKSSNELFSAFNEGLANRHTASTKMNVESSRSHLVIVIGLTIKSKQNGSVFKGKLTLVDLAGSERVHKSGATAAQMKEANSINKSLSALGDVISALSSEANFVPYRNSKLTMLLQDSLGGNAKTLVFVNISPSSYNAEETLVSLMYAARIKQITNNASKITENKEISRLKAIILKLKKGEEAEDYLL